VRFVAKQVIVLALLDTAIYVPELMFTFDREAPTLDYYLRHGGKSKIAIVYFVIREGGYFSSMQRG
jgi:hypothetical protein